LVSQKYKDLVEKGYRANPVVFATVRYLSRSVAEPPVYVYEKQEDGTKGKKLSWNHPLQKLMQRPNKWTSRYVRDIIIMFHIAAVGRSCWFVERGANTGTPMALWPLRPDRVGVVYASPDEYDKYDGPLKGWSYMLPGTSTYIFIRSDDIIFFHYPDPMGESGGMFEGLGPLQVLANEISADNNATQMVSDIIGNYATPGVILEVDRPLENLEAAKIIKYGFMRSYSGKRRGEPAVLEKGVTVKQMGFTLQQLEFPALRDVAESRITAALEVPAILVGANVGLNSSIRATIKEQRAAFTKGTCTSYWKMLQDAWTMQLAEQFDPSYMCEYDLTQVEALRADEVDRVDKAYVAGVLIVDEYREALGYEDVSEIPGIEDETDPGKRFAKTYAVGAGMNVTEDVGEMGGQEQLPVPAEGIPPAQGGVPSPASATVKAIRSWPVGGGLSVPAPSMTRRLNSPPSVRDRLGVLDQQAKDIVPSSEGQKEEKAGTEDFNKKLASFFDAHTKKAKANKSKAA
jgi:HK97 family phage portal protein